MNLIEQKHGAVTVLKPQGPVVGSDAEQFQARLIEAITHSMGRCVVDASAIPFVDSKALEALVEANDHLVRGGNALRLCGLNETLRTVLEMTDLMPNFEHFDDVNSAVRSFL